MDLISFVHVVRRWLWLIVLAALIAGGVAYAVSKTQPPQYEASTTIQVGAAVYQANPTTGLFQIGQDLAQTYAVFVKTYPVLDATISKLSLPLSTENLSKVVQTRILANTSLLVITVTYPDAARAADIANELAQQLILLSPTPVIRDQQHQIAALQDEIAKTQAQLQTGRSQVDTIDKQLTGTPSPEQTALVAQRQALINQLTASQANLAQMENTLASLQQQGNANTLTVIEQARPPKQPTPNSTLLNTALAAVVAAVLAAGIAFVTEIARQRPHALPAHPGSAVPLQSADMIPLPEPMNHSILRSSGRRKRRIQS